MKKLLVFVLLLTVIGFQRELFSQSPEQVLVIENDEKGLWNDSKRMDWNYASSLEIDEAHGIIIAGVADVATDSIGNVFICDNKDHCVKVFDSQGKFKYKIGQRGKGPGELLNPYNIAISRDRLYVADANRRISVFDQNGAFIKNYLPQNFIVNDMCSSFSAQFLFCTPKSPMHYFKKKVSLPAIYILNLQNGQFKETGELTYIGRTANGYQTSADSKILLLPSGDVLYAANYPYELKLFSETGHLKKIITRKTSIMKEPHRIEVRPGLKILIPETQIQNIYRLKNGNFMVSVLDIGANFLKSVGRHTANPPKDASLYIDIFNVQGEFLQSFKVTDPFDTGLILYCDRQNFVYTYNPDWNVQTIKKYRILFVEK